MFIKMFGIAMVATTLGLVTTASMACPCDKNATAKDKKAVISAENKSPSRPTVDVAPVGNE